MTQDANPFTAAYETAQRLDRARAPFFAIVVVVSGTQVEVIPFGQATSIGLCDASTEVVASAAPGDVVWCIPTGAVVFVAHIRAS